MKLRDQLIRITNPISASWSPVDERLFHFKQGFDACEAQYLPMIEKLESALSEIISYGHSDLCKTIKPIRENYTCHVEEAEQALAELEQFKNKMNGEK